MATNSTLTSTSAPPPLVYNNTSTLKATAVTVTAGNGTVLSASDYGSAVVTINASARTKAINITGNAKNNVIIGGSGADTLAGGKGNDTLTGGSGKDVFIYSAGNDVIKDYTAAQDTIQIASGSISSYYFSGDDAVFKIGSNTLKVKGGKTSAIALVDSKKNSYTYQSGMIQNNATASKATALTVTAAADSVIAANSYGAAVVTIDGSSRTKAFNITGNAKNNVIIGSSGNDTISGGKGKDTLYGGKGNDIFLYSTVDGAEVIADYGTGNDTIKLAGNYAVSYSTNKSGDALLKIGSSTVTMKGAADAEITIVGANNKSSVFGGKDTTPAGLSFNNTNTAKATVVTIGSAYSLSSFDAADYASTLVTINASARTKAIDITGNTKANKIYGGSGNDTLRGGAGKDTLYGGAGNDYFYYSTVDGAEVIADYGTGNDVIQLAGNYAVTHSVKGSDAILKIGANAVTVKGASETAVTVIGANNKSSVFGGKSTAPGKDTVYVTLPAETINVTLPAVTLPAETVTVGGGDAVTVTMPAETVTVGGGDPVTVTVSGGGSIIAGTSKADTLFGTDGNDTISLGAGNDVYIYEGGGDFDVITDYAEGADKISIGTNSVGNAMLVGSDVIFAINGGILKLDGAKDKKVTIISGGSETEYVNGTIPSSDTGTGGSDTVTVPAEETLDVDYDGVTVTLASTLSGTFSLPAYNASVSVAAVNVDGSSVQNAIAIYGDDEANIIRAGRAGGTIFAGNGNDVIYCGRGYDTIYYYSEGGGNDTVYDYKAGDVIYHRQSDSYDNTIFQNVSLSGDDIIVNYTSGEKITLKDAKNQRVYLYTYRYYGSDLYYNNTFGRVSISGNSVTLNSDYLGDFNTAHYTTAFANINASAASNAVTIHGNDNANTVYGGKGGSTIYTGAGNDSINGGKGNSYINAGNGDNTVYGSDNGSNAIYTGEGKDVIHFGNGGGTVSAGEGDDTIYCGRGYDTIYYYSEGGGNDIVYDYRTGDVIYQRQNDSYDNTIFQNVSLSGDDIIINYTSGEKITLKDARDQRVYLYTYRYYGSDLYYNNTFGRVSISGSSVTLNNDYLGDFNTAHYTMNLTNINASEATNGITIHGNDSANTVYGGRGGSTIYTGEGNDSINGGRGSSYINAGNGNNIVYGSDNGTNVIYTGEGKDTIHFGNGGGTVFAGDNDDVIYCGRGTDTIYYYSDGGGNDTVYDYKTGDVIYHRQRDSYDDTTFQNVSISGNDLILNFTSGEKITLKDAKDQRVYLYNYRYYGSDVIYNNTFGRVSISSGTASLNANYEGVFRASHYAAAINTINASAVTLATNLYGNAAANVIRAGKAGGSIFAGEGNDTIYCGAGNDSIVFYSGDGNDTVYNIGNNDAISLSGCSAESVTVSGSDVIITTDDNEKITLKDGAGKSIWISGKGTQTYTSVTSSADILNDIEEDVPWFAEDDNFMGSDLDSLLDDGNSLANLSLGAFDHDSILPFAQDKTPAYSFTNEK